MVEAHDKPARRNTDGRNTDGRIARGERTRELIVEAHAELLHEDVLRPTGKVIAERAGISLRTLWLNFHDLEALLEATSAYWLVADSAWWTPVDPVLPLAERIDVFCMQRAARLEHLAPAARSALLSEPFSAALTSARALHIERLRNDLDETFAAEIGARGDGGGTLVRGLMVAANSGAWSLMRHDLGLDALVATATMRASFTAQLAWSEGRPHDGR